MTKMASGGRGPSSRASGGPVAALLAEVGPAHQRPCRAGGPARRARRGSRRGGSRALLRRAGPVMQATRVAPPSSRCSVAWRAPRRLSTSTESMPAFCGRRSTATTGMPASTSGSSDDLVGRRHGDDDAGHAIGDGDVDVGGLLVEVLVGVAQHEAVVLALGDVLDAADHRGEERVLDVGDDRRPQRGALAAQRPGRPRRLVAQRLGRLAHPLGPLGRHRRRAVEHPRHRRRAHARPRGRRRRSSSRRASARPVAAGSRDEDTAAARRGRRSPPSVEIDFSARLRSAQRRGQGDPSHGLPARHRGRRRLLRRARLDRRRRRGRSRRPRASSRTRCDTILEKKETLAFDWAWEKGTERDQRDFRILQSSPTMFFPELNDGPLPLVGDRVRVGAAWAARSSSGTTSSWPSRPASAWPRGGTRTRPTGAATSTSRASPAGCRCTTSTSATAACTSSTGATATACSSTASRRTCRATSSAASPTSRARSPARSRSAASPSTTARRRT